MTVSTSDIYGYTAALISCVAFGSFAVPIRGIHSQIDVDPLVMQSYKTTVCFLTSWLVVWWLQQDDESVCFTPWGWASGLFWVPGGTAGIYAVRTVGLAVSQGIWSSLKVLIAFAWGIFVFEEAVQSKWGASVSILVMMLGLCGMSYFCAPQKRSHVVSEESNANTASVDDRDDEEMPNEEQQHEDAAANEHAPSEPPQQDQTTNGEATLMDSLTEPLLSEPPQEQEQDDERVNDTLDNTTAAASTTIRCCGLEIGKHQLGILGAIFDGAYGGSILVPMHYAKQDCEGLGYVISFACGSMTVLVVMWILRFLWQWAKHPASPGRAWQALPSLHLRTMGVPGSLAGLLWNVGNVSSILSVTYLGEGVGYSIVQTQLLVAGLWGVLWYREVSGCRNVVSWLSCATMTVVGIVLLGREHEGHHSPHP